MSFYELSQNMDDKEARKAFKANIMQLVKNLEFEKEMIQGIPEKQAKNQVIELVGSNLQDQVSRGKSRVLDALVDLHSEQVANRLQSVIDEIKTPSYIPPKNVQYIIDLLGAIPGNKIVTLNVNGMVESYDISANGQIGYSKQEFYNLAKLLEEAFEGQGFILVRQFIPNSEEVVESADGERVLMPWKALYGFMLAKQGFFALPAESVEATNTHDMDGNVVEEDMVIYKDISDFIKR